MKLQFSKKVVIAVTASVTAITLLAIGLCWDDGEHLVQVVKAYVEYATIVFASYSGNSIAEKIIYNRKEVDTNESG